MESCSDTCATDECCRRKEDSSEGGEDILSVGCLQSPLGCQEVQDQEESKWNQTEASAVHQKYAVVIFQDFNNKYDIVCNPFKLNLIYE